MQSNIDAMKSLKIHCDHITNVIADALKDNNGAELSEELKAALGRFDGYALDLFPLLCPSY